MRLRNIAVKRDTLNQASKLVCRVIDDETAPDEIRDEAAASQFLLTELLSYGYRSPDDDGFPVVPVEMNWPQFYTEMVEELLLDLGDSVHPLRAMLARGAAADVDNGLLSVDARLEHLEVLNEIICNIMQSAEPEVEAGENDEIDYDDQQFIRSNNVNH